MKPALGRGEIRCIGATTLKEYRKFISKDPAVDRRFQMVRVNPLSPEATRQVLLSMKTDLERHHGVHITQKSIDSTIELAERYLPNRHFPDKAIDYVLSEAGITMSQVDLVVFYDKPFLKFERLLETYLASVPRGFNSFRMAMPLWLREKLFLKDCPFQEKCQFFLR